MTQLTAPPTETVAAAHRPWRIAGGLGLAHVALMFAGLIIEGAATETSWSTVADHYRAGSFDRVYYGTYLEAMSFTLLAAALVLLSRLVGRTEVGRVAGRTALGLGVAYVAASVTIGFSPFTAAVYGAQHGADAGAVAMVDDLRNYGFVLQVGLSMALMVALGAAALAEGVLAKWAGWGGVVAGLVGLVATPFAHDATSMLFVVWWAGVCVLCLRGRPRPRTPRSV